MTATLEDYVRVVGDRETAFAFEERVLHSPDVTPHARAVLLGERDPDAQYWEWLIAQYDEECWATPLLPSE